MAEHSWPAADTPTEIIRRVRDIQTELLHASRRFSRPPQILAVSKTQPPEAVNALRGTNLWDIGESRTQEWQAKKPCIDANFRLHWIGRLQTNKLKYIIEDVCLVHSLDRPALADALDVAACAVSRRVPVLVQVNIAGETQKAGIAPDELEHFLRQYGGSPGLAIEGLMAMMPVATDPDTLRPYFRDMRQRFDALQKRGIAGVPMLHLSMGMSADYRVAAEEGATIVRIGSAIFGSRAPGAPVSPSL